MRILLTGSRGQLGQALRASLPAKLAGEPVDLITTARKPEPAQNVVGLDLADPEACHAAVMEHKPDWVLNAGATRRGPGGIRAGAGPGRQCRRSKGICRGTGT